MALIVWVLEAKNILWVYEQPATSLLFEHPRMRGLIKARNIFRSFMHMGSFGAPTPKPTMLWGPDPAVMQFALPLPKKTWETELVTREVRDGRVWVTGNGHMKGSQSYPPAFGTATLGVWKAWRDRQSSTDPGWGPVSHKKADTTKWSDADLAPVFQMLAHSAK